MTRHELLRKLIVTGHLNVKERAELTPGFIRSSEIIDIITDELHSRLFFPTEAKPSQQGAAVYEGVFLEKSGEGDYILHCQRGYAINPSVIAEQSTRKYYDIAKAIRAFIAAEYHSNIDGITIVEG